MARQSLLDGKKVRYDFENFIYEINFSAFHEGDMLPAKVIPSKNAAYVPHSGLEIFVPQFELLSGSGFSWIPSSNGHIPGN